jgi:hypothetical protein
MPIEHANVPNYCYQRRQNKHFLGLTAGFILDEYSYRIFFKTSHTYIFPLVCPYPLPLVQRPENNQSPMTGWQVVRQFFLPAE